MVIVYQMEREEKIRSEEFKNLSMEEAKELRKQLHPYHTIFFEGDNKVTCVSPKVFDSLISIFKKANTKNNFTSNLDLAKEKLNKAFNSAGFEDVTFTNQEAIVLRCYLISLEGQNERSIETNANLEVNLLHANKKEA